MHGVAGMGATLMPTIMQLKGRKYTFIGSCLLLLIGWILAFAAMDAFTIILSATFHGLATNCITIVNLVTVSEMLAPKYRSASMILLSINQTVGAAMVGVLGTVVNFKTIAMIMCGPVLVALTMAFIWPESPSWLACKGKFELSEKAFTWLRGTDDEAKKELQAMLTAQREARRIVANRTKLQEMYQKIIRKDFYLPSLYMFLILLNFYVCGAVSLFIYSKDVIELGTGDSKVAVIGYVLTVCTSLCGSVFSLVLIRFFKTKTVLSSALGCIAALFGCSLVPYLKSIGLVTKDSLLFLYFFLGYMVFCNLGFNPVTYALAIDLMPVKHRGIGGALFNVITCLLFVLTVKTLPFIILRINLSWTLFSHAVCSLICIILIWIYIPETKNRTLQEIEDYYNFGSFDKCLCLEDLEVNMPIIKNKVVE